MMKPVGRGLRSGSSVGPGIERRDRRNPDLECQHERLEDERSQETQLDGGTLQIEEDGGPPCNVLRFDCLTQEVHVLALLGRRAALACSKDWAVLCCQLSLERTLALARVSEEECQDMDS